MTKGQRAMVVAKIYPDGEKGGRGRTRACTHKIEIAMSNRWSMSAFPPKADIRPRDQDVC
jgi:hypothetical protein